MRYPSCLLLLLAGTLAAQSIDYSAARKTWILKTDSSAYAIGVNQRGELQNLYWGGPLWRSDDIGAAQAGPEWSSFDPSQSLTI